MASSTSSVSLRGRTRECRVPFWLWPNLLSLDAPIIAALWQNVFAQDAGVKLDVASRLVLLTAVWLIYLVDRLLDTRAPHSAQATARHGFCLGNRPLCYLLAAIAAVTSFIAAIFLPVGVFKNGVIVLGLVVIYMLMVHSMGGNIRRWLPKEAAVGLLFAVGASLAPFTSSPHPNHLVFPALLFGLLCWVNSAAIETWEGGCVDATSAWTVRHLGFMALVICALCLVRGISCPAEHSWVALMITSAGFCAVESVRLELSPDMLRTGIDIPLLAPVLLLGLR